MGRLAVATVVSIWVILVSVLVNFIVPDPYMDEIFHIPQAQQYCRGNFRSWDPMITTPPGLYYLSLAYVASVFPGMFLVQRVSSFFEVCSAAVLRSTNGVLAVICSILVYDIIIHVRPAVDDRKATVQAIVLALYPLHWFFTFLYYTDVASLTAVLATYLACLKRKYQLSALLGALAVIIRQTNIIWMLFVACAGIVNITLAQKRGGKKEYGPHVSLNEKDLSSRGSLASNLRKRRYERTVENDDISVPNKSTFHTTQASGLLDEIRAFVVTSWQMKREILVSFSPFLLVLIAFIAFVRWNGNVVLGAKDAHAVSLHFAQIMYVGLVCALAAAPMHLTPSRATTLFSSLWKNKLLSLFQGLIALIAGILSVHFFSIAHPYLLADNRHYPFYLWRKVIKAHWSMKYLLVPIYVYSWLSMIFILGKTQKKFWVLAYFLATVAVLVPAPLVEFRYYTIPFYFMILHSNINENRHWLLMGFMYVAVNVFTMMMFLFRPFHWDHEPGIQRFIW